MFLVLALCTSLLVGDSTVKHCPTPKHRSTTAIARFKKQTGYPNGRPGYVIDHIVPLCACGKDAPSNMQWQTVAAAKKKDVKEKRLCAKLRAAEKK